MLFSFKLTRGRQTLPTPCRPGRGAEQALLPPGSSERSRNGGRGHAGPSGREARSHRSKATAPPARPACLPAHGSGSYELARLAPGGKAKVRPHGAAPPAWQPCYFQQHLQAGSCGGIKGTYRQGETALQHLPTSSSGHDYQRVRFCCFFMLTNFPKLYKCLISIACAQNVMSGYGLLSINGRCVI